MEVDGPIDDQSTDFGYNLLFSDLPVQRLDAGATHGLVLQIPIRSFSPSGDPSNPVGPSGPQVFKALEEADPAVDWVVHGSTMFVSMFYPKNRLKMLGGCFIGSWLRRISAKFFQVILIAFTNSSRMNLVVGSVLQTPCSLPTPLCSHLRV